MTGDGIDGALLHVGRTINGSRMRAECDDKPFPSTDAAMEYALAQGFLRIYNRRPNGFIDLRLSPATRRYLRSKTDKQIWALLPRILGVTDRNDYFHSVRVKDYMADTRKRWMDSIRVLGGRRSTYTARA